jgi:hypothetical protein
MMAIGYWAVALLTFVLVARFYPWSQNDCRGALSLLCALIWPVALGVAAVGWFVIFADRAANWLSGEAR